MKLITQQKPNADNDTYDKEEFINIKNASWMHFVNYGLFQKKVLASQSLKNGIIKK